jgi:tRNA 2-(methylsulfanyl)-N6-isopentenyladenosine37 hydroxylase
MLGLKVETDAAWVSAAMRDLDRVLVDHAHCEMKAASNALSLVTRHPDDAALVRALTDVAREELEHFARVLAILEARGLPLGSPPVDDYAAALRRAAQVDTRGPKVGPFADRLLVGALIEARSCERFKLLALALENAGEHEVSAFYTELLAAEARHYRSFVDLAASATTASRDEVLLRLDVLAECEAEIVRGLALGSQPRASIHG